MKESDVVDYFGQKIKFCYLSLPEKILFLKENGFESETGQLIKRQGISPQ